VPTLDMLERKKKNKLKKTQSGHKCRSNTDTTFTEATSGPTNSCLLFSGLAKNIRVQSSLYRAMPALRRSN